MPKLPDIGSRRLYHRGIGRAGPHVAERRLRPLLMAGLPPPELADMIRHLLGLQELADAAGRSFVEFVEGPAPDVAHAAGVVTELRRVLARARPSSRKQGLLDLARRLHREAVGTFHLAIAAGVEAYAPTCTGPRGNPVKQRGAATNRARQLVNAALAQLVTEHMREEKDFRWLFGPGSAAGHAKVIERAEALAVDAGERISRAQLSRQVTEASRSALSVRHGALKWALTVRPRLKAGVSR